MPLYDHWGRVIDVPALGKEQATATVFGVRPLLSGHPAQGLTPSRLGTILRAAEDSDPNDYLELAEEMEEKDLHYRSVLSTRKMQVSGMELAIVPADESPESQQDVDLLTRWLHKDTLRAALFDLLDAVGKGYSVCEIIWNCRQDVWLPKRFEWRDPRWFLFDRRDGRTLLLRTEDGKGEPLKPYKFITHCHPGKSGLPVRGGLARAVAWAYLFKNFDLKSWVDFSEGFGQPLRLGRYGVGASETQKATLLHAVRNIARDAAAIIPDGMAIEFIEAKITGNIDLFERLADWLDRQVSKAVLGQTGTTDTGQYVGTANAHEAVRNDIITFDAAQLAATLNRDVIRPIITLNHGQRCQYPKLVLQRPVSITSGASS